MVTTARWSEDRQVWQVQVQKTNGNELIRSRTVDNSDLVGEVVTEECDILINASGFVNDWGWPAIFGMAEFKGTVAHTAAWDKAINLDGKRVAVIGNGSSGV